MVWAGHWGQELLLERELHPPGCDAAAASSQGAFSVQVMAQGSTQVAERLSLGEEHGPGMGSTRGRRCGRISLGEERGPVTGSTGGRQHGRKHPVSALKRVAVPCSGGIWQGQAHGNTPNACELRKLCLAVLEAENMPWLWLLVLVLLRGG